ncbi:Rv1733c family protein [Streptomyces scopuliridis]
MSTSQKFWRWRRNPLKRGTDRAEAWAVLTSGLLLVVGAPLAGVATGMSVAASDPRLPADWHSVSAVLTRKAPAPAPADEVSHSDRVRATVEWRTADGSRHRGLAWVMPNTPAGRGVTVWLDGTDRIREDPNRGLQVRALALGTAAAMGTAALATAGFVLVHVRLARRREWQLDREWRDVGPKWRPRRT